jgi:hypothetical protein
MPTTSPIMPSRIRWMPSMKLVCRRYCVPVTIAVPCFAAWSCAAQQRVVARDVDAHGLLGEDVLLRGHRRCDVHVAEARRRREDHEIDVLQVASTFWIAVKPAEDPVVGHVRRARSALAFRASRTPPSPSRRRGRTSRRA